MTEKATGEVFADRRLLEPDHLPDRDRIVDRDERIAHLDDAVNPMVFGRPPENVLIAGPPGSGKTMCTRYVAERETRYAEEQGVAAAVAHVDCLFDGTETRGVRSVARDLNDPDETGITIPARGLSLSAYEERLRAVLDACYDVVLLVFDRVEHAESVDALARLAERGTESCDVGVIAIGSEASSRIVDEVTTELVDRRLDFSPYEPAELRAILEARRDAFRPDALESGVIPRVVEHVSDIRPDATTAVATLLATGDVARAEGADTVRPEFVPRAHRWARSRRLRELLDQMPGHGERLLLALARLSVESPETDGFRTSRVYESYASDCRERGEEPLTARRARDLLRCHAELETTERGQHWGGRAEGNFTTHSLLVPPEIVEQAVEGRVPDGT